MIVRNEANVICRCLGSVRSLISYWVICDTGSTDKTKDLIQQTLHDIPGDLFTDSWVDFAHNRSLGIARAKGKADYHLLIDADMVLNCHGPLRELTADQYLIRFEGELDYSVSRLVSDKLDWHYKGVTHEYIYSPAAKDAEPLSELSITHHEDGGDRANRYQRDIGLLQRGLKAEPENPRYHYYLAQCYRDSDNFEEALKYYERRIQMGGWNQEIWSALYQIGRMQELLGYDWRVILNSYLQAFNYRPSRLEPVYRIASFYRQYQQFTLGYIFSRLVYYTPYPTDILFVERGVYKFHLPWEHAECCFGLGKLQEGLAVCRTLLTNGGLRPSQENTIRNLIQLHGGAYDPERSETTCSAPSDVQPINSEGLFSGNSGMSSEKDDLAPRVKRPAILSFVEPGWWEEG